VLDVPLYSRLFCFALWFFALCTSTDGNAVPRLPPSLIAFLEYFLPAFDL
jgi:hypothetical protein